MTVHLCEKVLDPKMTQIQSLYPGGAQLPAFKAFSLLLNIVAAHF